MIPDYAGSEKTRFFDDARDGSEVAKTDASDFKWRVVGVGITTNARGVIFAGIFVDVVFENECGIFTHFVPAVAAATRQNVEIVIVVFLVKFDLVFERAISTRRNIREWKILGRELAE